MPHTAILYIAERCNQNCVFCLEEDGGWAEFVDPTTLEVFEVLERLYGRGARHITFMGGETFFRKDLPRILTRAKQLGYTRLGVTTNGTVLSKPGFITQLVNAGLDFVEFSLHGHTEELANAISRSAITFERQARALSEIDALGTKTILNVVVCRENHAHLRDIAQHMCETYPNIPLRFKFKFVSLQGLAASRDALSYEEVDFVSVGDYLAERNAEFWFYNVPLCRLGPHAKRAHEVSTLSVDERYFDFDHRNGADYYDSGHQLEGRVWPAKTCRPCGFRPLCPGLEESYRLAHGEGSIATRTDDPVAALEFALADRGDDPKLAAQRLAELANEERPEKFVKGRPEGALRFRRGDRLVDLTVEEKKAGVPSFAESARFALSQLAYDDADRNPDATVMRLLDRASRAMRAADRADAPLERIRTSVIESCSTDGWALETGSTTGYMKRKRTTLLVLPDLGLDVRSTATPP
jgi:organic radical activating enzyme